MIKAITNRDPVFLKDAYKHDLELHNDDRTIQRGERYIMYQRGKWCVYTRGDNLNSIRGRFDNIMSAMFCAKA